MKRGITPLVATVLLISFAITFGAFAMTIGQKIGESSEKNVSRICKEAALEFLDIGGRPYVCTTDDEIRFVAVNSGRHTLESIQLIIVGDSINIHNIQSQLAPHDSYEGKVSYDKEKIGKIKELQFLVRVIAPGSDSQTLCVKNPTVIVPYPC